MNYEQPDLLEQLAGAYVLGSLRGSPRARFDQLCLQSDVARVAVRRWEDWLMPLLPALSPVAPREQVWARILQRIRGQATSAKLAAAPWRWVLAGAAALSLLVGISILLLNPPMQVMAVIGQDVVHPLWRVSRTSDSRALTIQAVQQVRTNPQLAYELWALPGGGKPPVSLGLMPRTGRLERSLNAVQRAGLAGSSRIAVSLEPVGGSPTGQPTGPVLFVVDVHRSG